MTIKTDAENLLDTAIDLIRQVLVKHETNVLSEFQTILAAKKHELMLIYKERDDLRAALALESGIRLQLANDSQMHLDRALNAEAALTTARQKERERLATILDERAANFAPDSAPCNKWVIKWLKHAASGFRALADEPERSE